MIECDYMAEEYWSKENIMGIGTGISSSPVLAGNKIIFGAHDTYIYALDSDSGKIEWKFKTNGCIYSTPYVHKDTVYAGSQDGFLYAIGLDGKLKWKFQANGRVVGSSPVVINDKIIFGTDEGFLFAVDIEGKLLWKFLTGSAIRTTVSAVNDKIIFGSHDHYLYCIDENGSKIWKFFTGGPMWTCPCIVDRDGNLLWSVNKKSPEISENFMVYFGSFDGNLYCLDENGNFIWKFHTGNINASGPEFYDGIVYFGSSDRHLYAIDYKSGVLKWKFRTTGAIGHSSPVIYKENIFICDFIFGEDAEGGSIYCLNMNGEILWSFRTDNAIVSTPLIHNDMLFVGSWDGYMYAISLKKQELVWKFRTLFDRLNFDIEESLKHIEEQEEQAKRIFGVWKPETTTPSIQTQKSKYGTLNVGYNEITSGGVSDRERFSYSPTNLYETKRQKDKSGYK